MKLYFAGAESPSHRKRLLGLGVDSVALNVTALYGRLPKKGGWSIPDRYPGCSVALYPGDKDDDDETYGAFIDAHHEHADIIVGMPGMHRSFENFAPLWIGTLVSLSELCEQYGAVAIPNAMLEGANTLRRIAAIQQRTGVRLVAITSTTEVIDAVPWAAVISSAWQSTQRFGELQVWDGRALVRYSTEEKEQAVQRHQAHAVQLGVDFEALAEGDISAVMHLAIESWRAYERAVGVAPTPVSPDDDNAHGDLIGVDPAPVAVRHEVRDQVPLPVAGIITEMVSMGKQPDGTEEMQEQEILNLSHKSLRQCDSCFLSRNCPGFRPRHVCGYNLPLEIRTKDQLLATCRIMVEMQAQRVLFARFAEELEGAGTDPALSGELDRFLRMVREFRDLADTRDFLKVEIEARGNAGILSRVFGQRIGDANRELPAGPITGDRAVEYLTE